MRSQLVITLCASLGLTACAADLNPVLELEDTGYGAEAAGKGHTTSAGDDAAGQKKPLEAVKPGAYPLLGKYFLDADGDGHGDPSQLLVAFRPPDGYVANDGDCDDDDPAINPDAEERCNGLDDDCDGDVEEIESHGGHDYAFCHLPGEETHHQAARERCMDFPQGMDLVVITGEAERDFVRSVWAGIRLDSEPVANHVGNDEYVAWIGYTDQTVENVWVWTDGYAHGYDDWCSDEPNDAGGEDCAVTGWTADYEYGPGCEQGWNDLDCGVLAPFVCEVVD